MRRLPEDVEAAIVERYRDGKSSRAVARDLGVSQRSVFRVLHSCGIETRDQVTAQSDIKDPAEVVCLYESGLSIDRIAARLGFEYGPVRNALIRAGVVRRSRNSYTRENAPAWKGGRILHAAGYVLIYRPEHPRATPNGYVREHILVMEEVVGGPLPEGVEVHHINGIKDDNRVENLRIFTKAEHARLHAAERKAATA